METASLWIATFLVLNVVAGVASASRGREPASFLLSAMLFGTTGVAVVLLLAEALDQPPLRDVAVVFVALAALAVIVFAQRGRSTAADGETAGDSERGVDVGEEPR